MSDLTCPDWLGLASVEFGLTKSTVGHRSPVNNWFQAVDMLGERWVIAITLPDSLRSDSGRVEAFFNSLSGGLQGVAMWHFARPEPMGTMRGTPTLAASAAQFANAFVVQTTPGATVKAGDMLGFGGQLYQIKNDAVANGSGVLAINTVNRARAAVSSGASVVWSKPTARFILPSSSTRFAHLQGYMGGPAFELEEG